MKLLFHRKTVKIKNTRKKLVNKILRTYLAIGVVILVLITSAGIFGYLSNAYQGATLGFEKQSTELIALEDRLEHLLGQQLKRRAFVFLCDQYDLMQHQLMQE